MPHRLEPFAHGLTVVLSGELDAYDAPSLRDLFDGVTERVVVVDLARVTFLDSTALGTLVRLLRRQRESGGELRVVLPDTTARRIFEVSGLERTLDVRTSRADAMRP